MEIVRTPDERFVDLPDFPFEPRYAEVPTLDPADGDGATLRVAYLDEGSSDAAPVLLMHGEPSWSFLYRHMIPVLVERGHRVIAPDLVGFGRSDKPTSTSDYTYARHVAWMEDLLVRQLDLRDVTFFGQDWGGLVGLRVVAANPDRFARLVVGNTGDPATPLSNAQAVAERLRSGVLLTVDMSGHTAYGSDACATRVIERYLTELALPSSDARCPGA